MCCARGGNRGEAVFLVHRSGRGTFESFGAKEHTFTRPPNKTASILGVWTETRIFCLRPDEFCVFFSRTWSFSGAASDGVADATAAHGAKAQNLRPVWDLLSHHDAELHGMRE